jgi:hypothetical protein
MTDTKAEQTPEHLKRLMHELEKGLISRIQDLERETRRYRRLWIAMVIVFCIVLGLGIALVMLAGRHSLPGQVAEVVEARQFQIRDEQGAVRGAWGIDQDGALRLTLLAPNSKAAVTMTVLKGGAPGLTFADTSGHARGVLALLPDETLSLTFADRSGLTRSVLGLNPEGSATLVFADRTGATRAGMGVDSRGNGTFTLMDRRGASQMESDAPASAPAPAEPSPPADTGANPGPARSQASPPGRTPSKPR